MVHPDEKGNFLINLDWKKDPASIEVIAEGFQPEVRTFSSVQWLSGIRIELKEVFPENKGAGTGAEDELLQKIEMGNVRFEKKEE